MRWGSPAFNKLSSINRFILLPTDEYERCNLIAICLIDAVDRMLMSELMCSSVQAVNLFPIDAGFRSKSHFACVEAGVNADTAGSRNALSEKYKLIARHAIAPAMEMMAARRDRAIAIAR